MRRIKWSSRIIFTNIGNAKYIIFDIYDTKCGWTAFISKQNTTDEAGQPIGNAQR